MTCTASCVEPLECEPSATGGSSVEAYVVQFVSPDAGAVLNLSTATVAFEVSLRCRGGGTVGLPAAVPLSLSGAVTQRTAVLPMSAGRYVGAQALPAVEAVLVAVAGWDGGPAVTRSFVVDRVAPLLRLDVAPSLDGGPNGRDQHFPAVLRSSEPLATRQLTLQGRSGGALAQPAEAGSASCAARGLDASINDQCALLDLSTPPLAGLEDSFIATFNAQDLAGNAGPQVTAGVQVSRVRWLAQVPDAGRITAAPALDSAGNLYLGSALAGGSGAVHSFSPFGAWRFGLATAPVTSLAVSESALPSGRGEVLFVPMGSPSPSSRTTRIDAYSTDGGLQASLPGISGQSSATLALVDGGLTQGGALEARAYVFVNGGSDFIGLRAGSLCEWSLLSDAQCVDLGMNDLAPPVGGVLLSLVNVVVDQAGSAWVQLTNQSLARIDVARQVSASSSTGGHCRLPEARADRAVAEVAAHRGQRREPRLRAEPRVSLIRPGPRHSRRRRTRPPHSRPRGWPPTSRRRCWRSRRSTSRRP